MEEITLLSPIEDFEWNKVSQLFGVNKSLYKPRFGIPGHNGLDIMGDDEKMGYGTRIHASHPGKVVKVFSDFPTKTHGTGIYLQQQLPSGRFIETVYWHLSDVTVKPGDDVKLWDVIGLMGNTGFVLPKPTRWCPYCGTHLHFACRIYNEDKTIKYGDYGGFVDPTPWLYTAGKKLQIIFSRDLYLGRMGNDVSWLQTLLKIEGFAKDYEPIGFFGMKTLRDCIKLQKKYFITPALGYVGPKTRLLMNNRYSSLV